MIEHKRALLQRLKSKAQSFMHVMNAAPTVIFFRGLSPLMIFSLRFIIVCFLLFILLEHPLSWVFEPMNLFNADMVKLCLMLVGYAPVVKGTFLSLNGFSIHIVGECSAVFLYVLYLAFIGAYPSSWRAKLSGLVVGIPIIGLINILRIVGVFIAGVYNKALFDFLHLYLAQILMIAVVVCLCMIWLNGLKNVSRSVSALAFAGTLLLLSTLPFGLWLVASRAYVRGCYQAIHTLFSCFGIEVAVPQSLAIYPDTFITINLVTTCTLVMFRIIRQEKDRGPGAVNRISGMIGRHGKMILISFLITVSGNLLFFLTLTLFYTLKQPYLVYLINGLLMLNEWLLPFGIWIYLFSGDIFRKQGDASFMTQGNHIKI